MDVAAWTTSKRDGGLDYHLDGVNLKADQLLLDETNSLYAFVQGDKVKYIGKTSRTVRERFVTYKKPGVRQPTNLRCNARIREMLSRNEVIRIFVFNPISFLRYGDFDINLAAGLEDSLIAEFDPPWNGRERGRPITEEAEREETEEAPTNSDHESVGMAAEPSNERGPIATPKPISSFHMTLGDTYFYKGLINVGVDASAYLGDDGEPIAVVFGDGSDPVISRINRTANKSGGVRVVGRNPAIAKWLQKYFRKGEVLRALVLDRNRILLLPPGADQGTNTT